MNVCLRGVLLGAAGLAIAAGVTGCTSTSKKVASTTSAGSAASGSLVLTTAAGSSAGRSSTSASTRTATGGATSGGAEQPTSSTKPTCGYASSALVATAFGGTVTNEALSTSGTGNSLCRYTLSRTNLNAPGTVSLTLNTQGNAGVFAKVRQQYPGAVSITGVGDSAFFVPASGVLQFIRGAKVVIMETTVRVPGGPAPDPAKLRTDVVALGKGIVTEL